MEVERLRYTYLHNKSGNHNKFYVAEVVQEITHSDPAVVKYNVITSFGRIGSTGRVRVIGCASEDEAQSMADRIIREKSSKGYKIILISDVNGLARYGSPVNPVEAAKLLSDDLILAEMTRRGLWKHL